MTMFVNTKQCEINDPLKAWWKWHDLSYPTVFLLVKRTPCNTGQQRLLGGAAKTFKTRNSCNSSWIKTSTLVLTRGRDRADETKGGIAATEGMEQSAGSKLEDRLYKYYYKSTVRVCLVPLYLADNVLHLGLTLFEYPKISLCITRSTLSPL